MKSSVAPRLGDDEILTAFQKIDVNSDGTLSADELYRMVEILCGGRLEQTARLSPEALSPVAPGSDESSETEGEGHAAEAAVREAISGIVAGILDLADVNRDGCIDVDEFKAIMKAATGQGMTAGGKRADDAGIRASRSLPHDGRPGSSASKSLSLEEHRRTTSARQETSLTEPRDASKAAESPFWNALSMVLTPQPGAPLGWLRFFAKRTAQAPCLSPEAEAELRGAFKLFDLNGDGLISAEELSVMLSRLGGCSCDKEGGKRCQQGTCPGSATAPNSQGPLRPRSLRRVPPKCCTSAVSVTECEEMIKKVDRNGDGMVDFSEFSDMMAR